MANLTRAEAAASTDTIYDVIVIGAGINGVAVAREAALRGLRTIVLDRRDLGSGTSSWSSRLIHGGLRYLEHREFHLVHESLSDREALLRIAPHLVTPLPFVVPVYRHNKVPGWMLQAGMVLYDLLSIRKSVPRHRRLNRKALAMELPGLERRGLSGGLHYYDGQVVYAERLVLETMLSAAAAGAELLTYTTVTDVTPPGTDTSSADPCVVHAHDEVSGVELAIRGRTVVNAAGPWVDDIIGALGVDRQIGGTKGTHLVVNPFPGAPKTALYYEARSDNRAILVIPWNGRYLIGTTDDRFDGDLDTIAGTDDERDYLLAETNTLIPDAQLRPEDVLYSYAGIRPLPYRPNGSPGAIPRSHLIVEHACAPQMVSIVGGKLTPHLSLAEEVVDKVARLLGRDLAPSKARNRPLPGADHDWVRASARLRATMPWPAAVRDRLLNVYGRRAQDVIDMTTADHAQGRLLGAGASAIVLAEVTIAVQNEAAVHLTDILHRRTMVGLEPDHAVGVDIEVAKAAGALLGWDEARQDREVSAHRAYLARLHGGGVDSAVIID